jgi:ribosome maturation factor RimP
MGWAKKARLFCYPKHLQAAMANTKALETKVTELIADELTAIGYELVRVKLTSGGRYLTAQVMADRIDQKPMTVDDCAKISNAISPKLDAAPELADKYTLEVSSPGIDRPLVRLKDFERYAGHVARIELDGPLNGEAGAPRRFQGSIVRVTGNADAAEIEIKTETGDIRVPASAIAQARLVLTDALMNAHTDTKH